ncbi:hypothetical protein CFP71_13460 [Amycolatopsis thailandensis]|uniref:Uncharacterized protein n=1 Tax=Amycolatopsis thailandensis TaxID=589330 RepID=A0A229SC51_9PSEU|nr:hypothetical protein CFP71_13460 [Amycolatopsis thailandensis]
MRCCTVVAPRLSARMVSRFRAVMSLAVKRLDEACLLQAGKMSSTLESNVPSVRSPAMCPVEEVW